MSGLWATAGANWALYFAEEMHEARSRIGRVIAWTGALAAVSIAAPMILMVMGADDLRGILAAETPVATFLRRSGGPVLSGAISFGVVAAIFKAPLHPIVPLFGLGVTAAAMAADWMDPDAGRPSVILLTGLFLAAMAYFHFRLRETSARWLVADVAPPS